MRQFYSVLVKQQLSIKHSNYCASVRTSSAKRKITLPLDQQFKKNYNINSAAKINLRMLAIVTELRLCTIVERLGKNYRVRLLTDLSPDAIIRYGTIVQALVVVDQSTT